MSRFHFPTPTEQTLMIDWDVSQSFHTRNGFLKRLRGIGATKRRPSVKE
jgi:hypothetical protein